MIILGAVAVAVWLFGVIVLVRGYPVVVKGRSGLRLFHAAAIVLWPIGLVVVAAISATRRDQ